jgi:hypothetical protein
VAAVSVDGVESDGTTPVSSLNVTIPADGRGTGDRRQGVTSANDGDDGDHIRVSRTRGNVTLDRRAPGSRARPTRRSRSADPASVNDLPFSVAAGMAGPLPAVGSTAR